MPLWTHDLSIYLIKYVDATDVDDADVDAPDDAEAEEDVPSGWDSNC